MKGFLLAIITLPVVAGGASAAEFSFGDPVRLVLARDQARNIAMGDANGDGRNDIAVTTFQQPGSHRLSVFLQSGDGAIGPPVGLSLGEGWSFTTPVAFADLDGDGASEILLGTVLDGLRVARVSGSGSLSVTEHGADNGCYFVATGDVDGDGNVDAVCHDWKVTATVFLGDGAGGFGEPASFTTLAGHYDYDFKTLRLADVTGDGLGDLMIAASSVAVFFVHPNDGTGGFLPPRAYAHPRSEAATWPGALAVLDLDGDGVNEIVTANPENRPQSRLNVYRRAENGFMALAEQVDVHDSVTALHAGDLDDDGIEELVAGHYGFNAASVVGLGQSGLAQQARYDLPGFAGYGNAIALGDLDGDGCVDLAGTSYSGVFVLHGCRPFHGSLPVDDYDGDGVSDVLWYNPIFSTVWHWADAGAYRRKLYADLPYLGTGRFVAQAAGDFNGDGASDLFWRDLDSGENQVRLSTYYLQPTTTVTAMAWQVVGAGDFDGDDREDLLWRNDRTGQNAIWKSADSTTQQAITDLEDVRWKVAGIGDFDGDRQADILWRHDATGQNVIWQGGSAATHRKLPLVTTAWAVAGVGDFDGDGKDDAVWRNEENGANTIWLSANPATQQRVRGVGNLDWKIVATGDYNGDGDADLFWRNMATGHNVIWRSADVDDSQDVARVELNVQVAP